MNQYRIQPFGPDDEVQFEILENGRSIAICDVRADAEKIVRALEQYEPAPLKSAIGKRKRKTA